MTNYTPPVAFSFTVALDGNNDPAAAFQEVSGLESTLDTETVAEGGENRFAHNLPRSVKHPNLKLKRGLMPASAPLVQWVKDTLESDFATPIKPRNLTVALIGADGNPLRSWALSNAWPVKWSVGSFDAMKNELVIETIELTCDTVTCKAY